MRHNPFIKQQLPEFPNEPPTVRLFLEQVKRFRVDFGKLLDFAATICDVPPEELCDLHLIAHHPELRFLWERACMKDEYDESWY